MSHADATRCCGISLHHSYFASVPNQLDETLGCNDPLLAKLLPTLVMLASGDGESEENHRNTLIPDAADRRHMAYCVNRIYRDAARATRGGLYPGSRFAR